MATNGFFGKVKGFFKRLLCRVFRRHTKEYMKNHGAMFHQFYGVNGGGIQCTCPLCGFHIIIRGKK